MPPRRQPCSLSQHCINYFASTLDHLGQVHQYEFNHPQILTALNYITYYLPISVQADIGETIVLHKDCLQLPLLASHIKILLRLKAKNISLLGSVVQSGVLDQADAFHLERLSLFYRGSVDRAARICNFLITATNLTHLECTNFCSNDMLGVIASCCANLCCLDLRSCDVTNKGVLLLCGFQENFLECIESQIVNGKACLKPVSACSQTLREIRLSMTKITEAGVAIILLALTNIRILRVPDITMEKLFTFLKRIDHTGVQCNLKEFCSREILDEEQLTVLTGLCPNLEYIQMSFSGNMNMDLIRLHKLMQLKKLSGAEFAGVHTDALMMFLQRRGIQFKKLNLYTCRTKLSQEKLKITHTHLRNLAICCPNLKSLILEDYCLDEDSRPTDDPHFFKNLHTLKLFSLRLSDEDLRVFLYKCTRMRTLELVLKEPHVMHDNLVNELLDGGVWRNLTRIKILNSPITKKTLFRLVNECPNLRTLGGLNTWLVAKDQVAEFKERMRKENLAIEIN